MRMCGYRVLREGLHEQLKRVKPLRKFVRRLKTLEAQYRCDLWVLNGRERSSGACLTVFFAGQLESKNYIGHKVFGDTWAETPPRRVRRRSLLRRAQSKRGEHELAIFETGDPARVLAQLPSALLVPCWVGGTQDLRVVDRLAEYSQDVENDLKRIRRNRLDYRVTTDPAEFNRFYHTMYVPYITRTFGDHAFLMQFDELHAALPNCELLLITQDGQDIAGSIIIYEHGRPRGWSVGVKDGDSRWVKAGGLSAIQYLRAQYLRSRGFTQLHQGASRPFLNDGALRFKRKLGMALVDRAPNWFAFLVKRDSVSVRAFFRHNPVIYELNGGLNGALFRDSCSLPTGVEVNGLFREYYMLGLAELTLFCFDQNGSKSGGLVLQPVAQIDSAGVLRA
jgi:hypothetical protein